MHVLLYLECLVGTLHIEADVYVERLGSGSGLLVVATIDHELRVVGVLHPTSFVLLVEFLVDACGEELLVELLHEVELTGEVHHGACFSLLVDHEERGDASCTGHKGVVGTEGGCDMYDTRTILSGHIVAGDYAEGLCRSILPLSVLVNAHGFHPGEQLLILHAHEVGTLVLAHHLVGHELVAGLVVLECKVSSLGVEVHAEECLGQYHGHLLARVSVVGLHGHIVYLGAYAERRIGGQCPRCGGPCDEVWCTPLSHLGLGVLHAELTHNGGVLHVAIASGLVELV